VNRFTGRTVVITGAASGIGRAAAERFAAEGARVWLADRDGERLSEALAAVGADRHHAVEFDVTDETGWTAFADRLMQEADGRLDVLVNNAGSARSRLLAETSYADWQADRALNLDSVFLGTRAMLPLLAATGRGAIVNVSSIRGIVGGRNFAAYSAAKGGVRMFTKATALECAALGNGVRANSVHPGFILTPLAEQAFPDATSLQRRLSQIPLGRAGVPDDIANAIVFLASDDARYATGAELVIDGGSIAS
jgi:meso-butanediol dehydrogenase/(S,S)-butanediol dehydrogenase/diacetyl reductase